MVICFMPLVIGAVDGVAGQSIAHHSST
jgi:hypothetical protein